ncbi:F-box domain-containing protein [Strongyloides ratti]|uniref:F-box domain-containing protein n=1 Tax=Strongyloides ratti TaxID=34506 RepID=A0A090L7T6_STRRB|nr:F-box domain-containing protein [Strongyloides ratti]CEF65792.1 F-box domain-containing protein [Strongyloides ratti]
MNLLLLSEYIQLKIFSNVDSKSLFNVKLTCRRFYLIIEKNIHKMKRPKLCYIKLISNHINYIKKPIRIQYKICNQSEETFCYHSSVHDRKVCFVDMVEYEKFLYNCDLTMLCHIQLDYHENTDFIKLFNNCYDGNEYVESVVINNSAKISKRNNRDILNFIYKVKNTNSMVLKKVILNNQIHENYEFPVFSKLKYLQIEQIGNHCCITRNSILSLINNSKNEFTLNFISNNINFVKEISRCFADNVGSHTKYICAEKSFEVILCLHKNFTLSRSSFFKNILENNNFSVENTNIENFDCVYIGRKKCCFSSTSSLIELRFCIFNIYV